MSRPQFTTDRILMAMAGRAPVILPADRSHAAVAMVMRSAASGIELLFIRRAAHPGDPWSGDLGFPGGRLAAGEQDPRLAAERETREELGLDLGAARCCGRLDDLYGATLPVLVSCFAYHLETTPPLQPNHEIAESFWFPLAELLDPRRHHLASFTYRDRRISHPAVDLLGPGQTVLWGITYRLIRQFFILLGEDFGVPAGPVDARP